MDVFIYPQYFLTQSDRVNLLMTAMKILTGRFPCKFYSSTYFIRFTSGQKCKQYPHRFQMVEEQLFEILNNVTSCRISDDK